jgi:hypothetical protein
MCGIAWAYGRDWRQPDCFDGLNLEEAYRNSFFFDQTTETRRLQKPLIYGDDIILDHRNVFSVVECLETLGFQVNKEKSYYGNEAYRESCGKHYFNGHDVTPMNLKAGAISEDMVEPEVMGGLIDACNYAYTYGYVTLRSHLINFALYYPIGGFNAGKRPLGRNPILFSSDAELTAQRINDDDIPSFAIYCEHPRNNHLRERKFSVNKYPTVVPKRDTRWSLQRDELASIALTPCGFTPHTETEDEHKYIAWWRSRYHKSGSADNVSLPRNFWVEPDHSDVIQALNQIEPAVPVKADADGLRVVWRWTPTR